MSKTMLATAIVIGILLAIIIQNVQAAAMDMIQLIKLQTKLIPTRTELGNMGTAIYTNVTKLWTNLTKIPEVSVQTITYGIATMYLGGWGNWFMLQQVRNEFVNQVNTNWQVIGFGEKIVAM